MSNKATANPMMFGRMVVRRGARFTANQPMVVRLAWTQWKGRKKVRRRGAYEVSGTPSNEKLLELSKTHAPPQKWFEGDEEQLF